MSNKYQRFNPALYQEVIDYISTFTPEKFRSLSTRLKEQLGIDSLTLTTLVVGLEERFGMIFEDGDLDPAKMHTVKDIVKLVFFYRCGYTGEETQNATVGNN